MIQDVDDTLKALLVQKAPIDTTLIDIKFEMPNKDWSAGVSKPTINLYLYDVRENHELRSSQGTLVRNGNAGTVTRAPVRMDLTYMISAWTTDIADEHQLLGQILNALLQYPLLPPEVLQGSMVNQPAPLAAWIAQPERTANPWDFWGHVENRLKSGLSYVVTVYFEPFAAQSVQLVTQTTLNIQPVVPTSTEQ
jgi:hypothetical protein